jgi:hypothetical protein
MATVPQGVGGEGATVPRIVLPITSRGLAVTNRLCWGALGVAMLAAAGLILYLNRGTVFYLDEVDRFLSAPTLGPGDVLEPHAGHLTATSNVVFKAILETFGADYLAFRVLGASVVLLSAGLFYALVKRRIGALPALAPTLVLLFLGSSWDMVVIPFGFNVIFSTAAGLAALLVLERGDRRGDLAACALLALSVATFSVGLAFLAGVAISVLLRPDRWRRAWIFATPLVLYAAWFGWSLSSTNAADTEAKASNVLLVPNYVADSLAAATAAITGLSYDFASPLSVELGWGRPLAVGAVVALALRTRRGGVPALLWVALTIALVHWTLGALVFEVETRQAPGETRYIYVGAISVLLLAVGAATPIRFSKLGLIALFGACAVSLATNLAQLRDGAGPFRTGYSIAVRAELAMLELARDHVRPGSQVDFPEFNLSVPAERYLTAVDRYGSPAFPLPELERQGEGVRQRADQSLASLLDLRLEEAPAGRPADGCRRVRSGTPAGPIELELPPGGATFRAAEGGPAPVTVGRFADSASVDLGRLSPGERATLEIPPDTSARSWRATVGGASSIQVCEPR